MTKIEDLFDDGNYLKRLLNSGWSSEQPETTCKVYMNLNIRTSKGVEVYDTGPMVFFKRDKYEND